MSLAPDGGPTLDAHERTGISVGEREDIELLLTQPEIVAWLGLSKPELGALLDESREADDVDLIRVAA